MRCNVLSFLHTVFMNSGPKAVAPLRPAFFMRVDFAIVHFADAT
jgi:hypothetical protein